MQFGGNFEHAGKLIGLIGLGARTGLPLFFFLSAYLITELLLREQQRTGSIHFRAFYTRRALRIWPLYYLGIGLGILNALTVPYRSFPPAQILKMSVFLAWYHHVPFANEVDILWSISVEELFYLIWPAVVAYGGRKLVTIASLTLIPVSLASAVLSRGDTWFNPLVQFLFLASGALLSAQLNGKTLGSRTWGLRVSLFVTGMLAWLSGAFLLRHDWTALSYAVQALGCALVFFVFLGMSSDRLPPLFIYLGKISYGLYVFHLFSVETVRIILRHVFHLDLARGWLGFFVIDASALCLAVAAASLSYRYFEMPFLRLKEKFAYIQSRLA